MALKISIDSGKHTTKCYLRDKEGNAIRDSFPTKMKETEEVSTATKSSYVVSMNDQRYMMGELAPSYNFSTSKATELHKYAIYTMIHKYAENGELVHLAVGCPLSTYHNVEAREKYKKYIEGDRNISFTVNGETKKFTLDNVIVVPEGLGYLIKNAQTFENRTVGIVDIGGLNLNGCIYDKLVANKESYFTENMGANIFKNDLRLVLNERCEEEIGEDWIDMILERGYLSRKKEESKVIIDDFFKDFLNSKIISSMQKKRWPMGNFDIVFVGGGSLALRKHIKENVEDVIVPDNAQWENVEGAYLFLD